MSHTMEIPDEIWQTACLRFGKVNPASELRYILQREMMRWELQQDQLFVDQVKSAVKPPAASVPRSLRATRPDPCVECKVLITPGTWALYRSYGVPVPEWRHNECYEKAQKEGRI